MVSLMNCRAAPSSVLRALDLRFGFDCGLASGEPSASRLRRSERCCLVAAWVAARSLDSALLGFVGASVRSSGAQSAIGLSCLVQVLDAFTQVVQSPSLLLASHSSLSFSTHSSQIFQHDSLIWRYMT